VDQEDGRLRGINALLTHQYEILPGVLVQCGLLDAQEQFHNVNVCSDAYNMLLCESARYSRIQADYREVALAAWRIATGSSRKNSLFLLQFHVSMNNNSLLHKIN